MPPRPRQCLVASVFEGWGARKELVLGKFKVSGNRLPPELPLRQVSYPLTQAGEYPAGSWSLCCCELTRTWV